MKSMHPGFVDQLNLPPPAEPDVSSDIKTLLHALIVILSLLLFAVFAAASAQFLYDWALAH